MADRFLSSSLAQALSRMTEEGLRPLITNSGCEITCQLPAGITRSAWWIFGTGFVQLLDSDSNDRHYFLASSCPRDLLEGLSACRDALEGELREATHEQLGADYDAYLALLARGQG